jgi:nicotinic acid mononucleotide adenylyltransferase
MAEESKGEGLPEVTEGMRERSIQPHTSGSSESKQINLVLASTRMNPPTPGHMRVLEELIMQGIQKETNEVYVVLSKKNDDEYNPMNCKDKIYYLNGFNENEQKNKANFGSYKDDSMVFALKREMIKKINNTKSIFECVDERQFEPFDKFRDIIQNKLSMLRIDDGQTLGDDRRENEENIGGCEYDSITNALKREMIEKINNMKVIFECVDDGQKGPFHKVRDIIQNKLSMRRRGQTLGIYLVVGDDRSETLDNMKKIKINGQKLNENIDISTFEQIVIKREDSGDLKSKSLEDISRMNINEISPNQISGTLVRKLATDNPEKFLEIYSNYISDDKKLSLLGNINEGMSRISEEMKMREEDKASRRAMLAEDKASRRAMPAEDKASRRAMPAEDKASRRVMPAEDKASRRAMPAEAKASRRAMPAEDKASRRAMPAEAKASGRAMPAEDNKASRRARGLPGRGSVADRQTEIQGGRRIRQNIIRKTSSDQKRTTRKKKGGVSKKLRRRKTVKNKRKFRKNNNKTKNNKMKNRRQTRKHK